MQENSSPDTQDRRLVRLWPLALGAIGLFMLVCLIVAVAAIVLSGAPTLSREDSAIVQENTPVVQGTQDFGQPATQMPRATAVLIPKSGERSAGDPYIPELGNTGYDVGRYIIQLALDPAVRYVEGTTTIEAVSTLPGLSQLSLDLAGFEVSAVSVDGIATEFAREDKKLVVDLPGPLPAETPFTLVVAYRGEPLTEPSPYVGFVDHLGLHYPDGETLFAIGEPDGARYWFPANDHPRDKANFRFELVVPSGLTAVANGQLLESKSGAMPAGELGQLFVWEHNRPMAPYLAVVAVGPYERIDGVSPSGIPLRHYALPGLREELAKATSETVEAIDWMSELFGPYPFETFGYVTALVPGGSLETQTMVLLSGGMIGPRTAVHELSHMWFGNWVSLDSWSEMWRNEGFATYITTMWVTRDDPEELELQMAGMQSAAEENVRSYPLNNPPMENLFDFNVYFEGALAVHALRKEMGDEAFFAGLRAYFEQYGGETASDAQFQAVMEEAAGFSLEPFFSAWFGPG